LATLVAFIHALEASAQDDAIELLELLLTTCSSRPKRRQKGTPVQPQGT
jgi:hypothetical protein